jgi:hypothetical protein
LIRLETTSVFCFLWLTAIFNRFGLTIRNGVCLARHGAESDRVWWSCIGAREGRRCESPARIDLPNAFEGVVFVSRIEMASVFCFVRVTAIFNRENQQVRAL